MPGRNDSFYSMLQLRLPELLVQNDDISSLCSVKACQDMPREMRWNWNDFFFPPIKSMAQQISWSRQADAWGHHGLIGSVSCGQAVSKPPYNECLLKRFSGHSGRPKMMTGWWFQTTQWIHMTILTLRYARARWCEHVLKHYRLSQTSDDDPN